MILLKRYRNYYIYLFISVILVGVVSLGLMRSSKAEAVSALNFNAGNIINDAVFTNYRSMSANDIQKFLNSKVPVCDTNGTQASEYGGGTRAQFGASMGDPAPFICLKNYSQGGRSAAQIIYDASQKYRINPQVILVLLQKEQRLVTDDWPMTIQYRTATGYGCPDTAKCDSTYYGFANQVYWAAKMFRAIMDRSPTWYAPYVKGSNRIYYNPTKSCGYSTVNVVNWATAALYNYTPYQPNKATLQAGWGTAPCGAYGNRNFYLYFTSWFGSTQKSYPYIDNLDSQTIYSDAARTNVISSIPTLRADQTIYFTLKVTNTGTKTWSSSNVKLATINPDNRSSVFSDSSWKERNRPAYLQESTVNPGETGTFEFSLTAPSTNGTYTESFGLVAEGVSWMLDQTPIKYTIKVASPYNASLSTLNLYTNTNPKKAIRNSSTLSLEPNQKIFAVLKLKNSGTQTWNNSSTKLATINPNNRTSVFRDSSWPSSNRLAYMTESSVAPGQIGTFEFSLTAPSTNGTYKESFGLVAEGISWVSGYSLNETFKVAPKPLDRLGANERLYPGQAIRSADGRYRLILQGDGNLVLYSPRRALWASNTDHNSSGRTVMQGDGNLVVYNAGGRALWASNTARRGSSRLIMQSDGNLVIYDLHGKATWSSKTNGKI